MNLLADLLRWLVWFPLRALVQRLPLSWLPCLGSTVGLFLYLVEPGARKLRSVELAHLLGLDPQAARVLTAVRKSYRLDYTKLLQSFLYPIMDESHAARLFRYRNLEILDQGLTNGNGAIILLAHFGANQFSIPALGFKQYPINQLGSAPDDWHTLNRIRPSVIQQRIFQVRLADEQQLPTKFVYIKTSMRPAFDCLHNNELLIMAFDGRAGTQWLKVPLLNRILNVSSGPFSLSRLAGAPLIPLFMLYDYKGLHQCILEPPFQVPKTMDRDTDLITGARWFASLFETYLTQYPDHYVGLLCEARKRARIDQTPLFDDYELS